ncbi:MAG TPA: WecB/TagA/CpsF family glycosyltransferase [Fimbriimonadaceae bacterium]|nr:WecB/TagA/CpsF family glycosyltransferase [Fimbriimonadaceae bacterium]
MKAPTGQTARPEAPSRRLLGVEVSVLDMKGTLAFLEGMLESKEPGMVVTADSYGLVLAQSDEELASIYENATLVTADSSGVVWGLKRQGVKVNRVSGVDLVDGLCALSAANGYRIFLLGAAPGVADLAAERLRLRHPGCNIVGTRHGYFPIDDSDVVAQEIAPLQPDIVLVALGIPRQEKFIARELETIGAKVAMGVGGSLDVHSGRVKRAPRWVQALKLEWLWRLALNPRKFEKVARLPRFVWLVLRGGR